MTFVAFFEGAVNIHLDEKTINDIEESSYVRKTIFYKLTVGVNINDLCIYQRLADWLLAIPEKDLKTLTMEDVVKGIGGEYWDDSGNMC